MMICKHNIEDVKSDMEYKKFKVDDIKVLGCGNFGNTYSADLNGEKVVIKEIYIGKQDIKKLEREVDILKKFTKDCHDKHILCYIDSFIIQDKKLYIITEYIEGPNLNEYILNKKLDGEKRYKFILGVAYDLLITVEYLHQNRIIHGDIKSENIIMYNDGKEFYPVIIDFGLSCVFANDINKKIIIEKAKIYNEEDNKFKNSDKIYGDIFKKSDICLSSGGTPYFIPPETSPNRLPISIRTTYADIWAIGITLLSAAYLNIDKICPDAKNIPDLFFNYKMGTCPKLDFIDNKYIKYYGIKLYELIKLILNTNLNKRPSIDDLMKYIEKINFDVNTI